MLSQRVGLAPLEDLGWSEDFVLEEQSFSSSQEQEVGKVHWLLQISTAHLVILGISVPPYECFVQLPGRTHEL
jgi:hypothetical protein